MESRNLRWPVIAGVVVVVIVAIFAFTNLFTSDENRSLPDGVAQLNLNSVNGPDGDRYVPLFTLMEELNYNTKYDREKNVYHFGYTGAEFVYMPDTNQFSALGEKRSNNVIVRNGEAYISEDAVAELIEFVPDEDIEVLSEEDIQFLENKDEETDGYTIQGRFNADRIIQISKTQLNTPYVFGAPTGTTRIFDCSTFTKFLFAKEGIRLPRTSRAQSKLGKRVSIRNLQRGDLLFFYVPGRYRSNRIVGHVSVYMGKGRMIHAYPPDVKIDSLSNPAWREKFLFAKRIR